MNTFPLACRLAYNTIGGYYDDEGDFVFTITEGITALCEGLKASAVTSLECAAAPNLHADCTQYHCPADSQKCSALAEDLHVARFRRSLRNNQLRDKGWTALFKALCENKGDTIESWDLSGENVGFETVKALAEYISVSPALKSVEYACLPAQCVSAR